MVLQHAETRVFGVRKSSRLIPFTISTCAWDFSLPILLPLVEVDALVQFANSLDAGDTKEREGLLIFSVTLIYFLFLGGERGVKNRTGVLQN